MGSRADRTTSTSSLRLTYEDYASLPDDGRRYEILDGELAVTPAPLLRHQAIARNLLFLLEAHLRSRGGGKVFSAPVDVILDDHSVLQPDLVFVLSDHAQILTDRAVEGPPDLVVEILSDSTARRDRGVKMRLYERFAVPHYWIVDPAARTLEVYHLAGAAYALVARHGDSGMFESDLLPGLVIDLADVFVD